MRIIKKELEMPNSKAKDQKRKKHKLNELLKKQGRTANHVKRKGEIGNKNKCGSID